MSALDPTTAGTADAVPDPAAATGPRRGFVRVWLGRAEVDRAVFFSLSTRLWQLGSAPVTLALIARCFSPDVQGYYYTFAGLIALQSFFELGFQVVVVSVASHEWSRLGLGSRGEVEGDPEALSRLVSFGRLIFGWYAAAALLFVAVVTATGLAFFSRPDRGGVAWQGPWVTQVVLTGLLLGMLPFNALLEGCDQVAVVSQFRLRQAVLGNLAMWASIALGFGLWAGSVWAAVGVARDLGLLLVRYRRFFRPFFRPPAGSRVCWATEVWPMQWRLGLSGLVNYFAFSLYGPVIFRYHGAAEAGRTGMTLAAVNGLQSVALVWVMAKVPRFGVLIARKDYSTLDRLHRRASLVSLLVLAAGAAGLWGGTFALHRAGHPLSARLLPPLPTGLFLLATLPSQFMACLVSYMRAHKRDPSLPASVFSGLAVGLLVWHLGGRFGATGAAAGALAVNALCAAWVARIRSGFRRHCCPG